LLAHGWRWARGVGAGVRQSFSGTFDESNLEPGSWRADLQAMGILIFSRTEIVNELIPELRFGLLSVFASVPIQ
jgi:hypothetical protein